MRNKTVAAAAPFKALFKELIPWHFIYSLLRRCGVLRRCPPQIKKQMRKAHSRRGRAAFPKVGAAVMVELGLHNPLAAAMGANGKSEMVLAKRMLSAQPARSLLLGDRYYGVATVLAEVSLQEDSILGETLPEITYLYKPLPKDLKDDIRKNIAAAAVGKPVKITAQGVKSNS